jgi:RecB family exonuclease
VPERGLSLVTEAATYPYVLALRWLVADPERRAELIEPLLTSDVVGLSPAAARGLMRIARTTDDERSPAGALDHTEGLTPDEADAVTAAREVLDRAALFAGMSVQDAFRVLWDGLACSARIVAEGGPGLDTVVTFADVVADAAEGPDSGVEAFLEALDAGRHGPGWAAREAGGADAVQVLTAHGAAGREFDTVIVAGAVEGNFPSLTRPEPMFDLAALEGTISRSEHVRRRLADERRLFRMVLARASARVIVSASDAHPDELSQRSRFADEAGVKWEPAPVPGDDEPVSVREATAAWRRELADPVAEGWRRLAALDGLAALGSDPATWWCSRGWTDTGRPLHETLRLSYSRLSRLDNCELQHVLGDELGLGRTAGYQAWVGKLVHAIIEDCEADPPRLGKTKAEILAAVDARWRESEFPSKAVSAAYRRLVEERMLPNWWRSHGEGTSLAVERFFEFEFEGATIVGVIDRIGPIESGGTRITDFKTGSGDRAPKAEASLQLGIYYLAVEECEDLAEFRPVRVVELAYLQGRFRHEYETALQTWSVTHGKAEAYQAVMRAELARLVAEKRRLIEREIYRPNPRADCHWCDFKTLCPLFPQGAPVIEVAT